MRTYRLRSFLKKEESKSKKGATNEQKKRGGAIFGNMDALHSQEGLFGRASIAFLSLFFAPSRSKRTRFLGSNGECVYSTDEASTNDGAILERELGKKIKGRAPEGACVNRHKADAVQRKMDEIKSMKAYLHELAAEEQQHRREYAQEKFKRDALFPINPLSLFLFILNTLVRSRVSLTSLCVQTMVAFPREETAVEEWLLSVSLALVTMCVLNSSMLLCCLFGRGKNEEAEEFVSDSKLRRVLRRYLAIKAGKGCAMLIG